MKTKSPVASEVGEIVAVPRSGNYDRRQAMQQGGQDLQTTIYRTRQVEQNMCDRAGPSHVMSGKSGVDDRRQCERL